MVWRIDKLAARAHLELVKREKPKREPKSKGTLIVEQHRPMMNKLTDAERQQLMRAGFELIYGAPAESHPANRRR